TQAENTNKIIPNVSRNITSKRDGLPMFFEVYSEKPMDVKVNFIMKDTKNDVVHTEEISKRLDTNRTQIIHTIQNIALGLGNYSIHLEIKDIQAIILLVLPKHLSQGGLEFHLQFRTSIKQLLSLFISHHHLIYLI